ncbi:MAG TPA: hypothetical protein VHA76_01395 [Solirubrobacterales bacterium]|nr:hypothetical protein [Solirubrobacterales bacterium]
MKRLLDKLTYANVISTLCLVLLLGGGTAYAAARLGRNSVGSRQIKNGAVTPAKLSKAAKATMTGPAGKEGQRGATGPQGPAGTPGASGTGAPTPSASASAASDQALTGTPAPIAQTTITVDGQSRIEESTVAVFSTSVAGELSCEARITPAGGSSAAMGNPITLPTKAGNSAEGTAGGAALEPAGTYTVSVDCGTTGATDVVSADMNVIAGAP